MVKNRYRAIAFVLMFCFACLVRPAYPQDSDSEILVKGDPPLTSLMAGKVIVLLDWALELKLANENKLEIKKNLIRTWQSGVKSEMQGALELIDIYEKVFKMSEPDRNAARGKLHDLILQSLRSEPDDALAKMLLSAYDASRGKAVKAPAGAEAASPPSAASNIGADGFTGIYRMVRPRTISLTGGSSGSGVWIEYVTFLP